MSEKDPWDMDHKPGYEFRKAQDNAIDQNYTRGQFLDEYNEPSHYRPELPSSNRSHAGEDMTDTYLGR
jgi:predicted ribonuclease toxin of YeeF-YezG toxin-antitoxin module